MSNSISRSRIVLTILATLFVVIILFGAGLYFSLNSRNAARPEAIAALESDDSVAVSRPAGEDWYVFTPTDADPSTGFIIYPGGFVDPVAYAPTARDIAEDGYFVVIDPMPLNLAVLNIEAADEIIATYPQITAWAIGGHSLGGAMAAEYVAGNPDMIYGLALWAAYPAANTDLSGYDLAAVSIYGDADGVASIAAVLDGANRLPDNTVFVLIPGGNHTQFGRYGEALQRGDNPAGISRDEQQQIVVDSTVEMLSSIQPPN